MRRVASGRHGCRVGVAIGFMLPMVVWSQGTPPAALPGAPQIGVGCAFYANVPALTRVSGIQIVDESAASRGFVSSIYGLRRGDFEFRRAFDKEVFFELFGIAAEGWRHDYADLPKVELLTEAERLIDRVFEPALKQGDFISLRARGVYGGPHNVLLLGHTEGKYRIHDPLTGAMRTMGKKEVARTILSESKLGTKVKKRYFSAYHLVSVGSAPPLQGKPLRVPQFPEFLSLRLTGAQRKELGAKLATAGNINPADVEQIAKSLPAIDFAVITKANQDRMERVTVIDPDLPPKSMHGVVNLAKLSLNSYRIGARDLLPVWWIEGRPRVITGYAEAWGQRGEATLTWFTTQEQFRTVRMSEALAKLKASGSLIGYVEMPRDRSAAQPVSAEESH